MNELTVRTLVRRRREVFWTQVGADADEPQRVPELITLAGGIGKDLDNDPRLNLDQRHRAVLAAPPVRISSGHG